MSAGKAKKEVETIFDISSITVSKRMLESCRSARTRYGHHLENEQRMKAANREELRKKSVQDELREVDDLAHQAEKKLKMDLIVKSNAFRTKAKEKRVEIEEASKQIEKLEKSFRK